MLKFTSDLADMDAAGEEDNNIELNELLIQIQNKSDQLIEKGNWNLNYSEVGQFAFKMNSSLQLAAIKYLNDLPTPYNTDSFIRTCQATITTTKREFGTHSSWSLIAPLTTALLDLLKTLRTTSILVTGNKSINGCSSMFFDRLQ